MEQTFEKPLLEEGKLACKYLKEIRLLVAKTYGIKYTPEECIYKGPCCGWCHQCDNELEMLQKQLDAMGVKDLRNDIQPYVTNQVFPYNLDIDVKHGKPKEIALEEDMPYVSVIYDGKSSMWLITIILSIIYCFGTIYLILRKACHCLKIKYWVL